MCFYVFSGKSMHQEFSQIEKNNYFFQQCKKTNSCNAMGCFVKRSKYFSETNILLVKKGNTPLATEQTIYSRKIIFSSMCNDRGIFRRGGRMRTGCFQLGKQKKPAFLCGPGRQLRPGVTTSCILTRSFNGAMHSSCSGVQLILHFHFFYWQMCSKRPCLVGFFCFSWQYTQKYI